MFGVTQGRGFGINCPALSAGIRVFQDVQPLTVRCHQSVFNPVVDHLDEVAGAVWSAMQVAFFGRTFHLLASRRAIYVAATGGERLEYRVEVINDFRFAADHLAVAALQAPDAATSAHIDVVNSFRLQLARTANVINVVRVTTVNDDVVRAETGGQVGERLVHDRGWNHQPDGAGRWQFVNK